MWSRSHWSEAWNLYADFMKFVALKIGHTETISSIARKRTASCAASLSSMEWGMGATDGGSLPNYFSGTIGWILWLVMKPLPPCLYLEGFGPCPACAGDPSYSEAFQLPVIPPYHRQGAPTFKWLWWWILFISCALEDVIVIDT